MSHTPFILASYLISAAVLLWAALSPMISQRALLKQLKNRQPHMDKEQ